MVHAGCVFVAGIHPSRTWTSGSFESVRWNACVHKLDFGLYSHPNEFFGLGVNSKGKIPSTGKFPQRRFEPATLWTASPNTTNELFRPPDNQSNWLKSAAVSLFAQRAVVTWSSQQTIMSSNKLWMVAALDVIYTYPAFMLLAFVRWVIECLAWIMPQHDMMIGRDDKVRISCEWSRQCIIIHIVLALLLL